MTKRSLAVGVAAALAMLCIAPAAYGKAKANDMTSCVDLNNDGTCQSADLPLMSAYKNGVINTATVTPPTTSDTKKAKKKNGNETQARIGIVLGNTSFGGPIGGATILASGSIRVNGNVRTARNGGFLYLTAGGDIEVAPKANIKLGQFGGSLTAQNGGSVHIGAGAKISASDDVTSITISGNNIAIDDGAKITVNGYNAGIRVAATGALTVGKSVTVSATGSDEGPGRTSLTGHSDITLDGATLSGRGVEVKALASPGSAARHLKIVNSKITIPHGDGYLVLVADQGSGGAPSVSMSNNKLNPAGMQIDSVPAVS